MATRGDGLLRWEFNLANLFAVPIIIGTGVDNGVNMLYRWREERNKSQLILTKAVGKSVTICSLTAVAGFAALIPASHHGISTLGLVLSLGCSLILVATLIVLPAFLKVIGTDLDTCTPELPIANDALDQKSMTSDKPRRLASGGLKMLPKILSMTRPIVALVFGALLMPSIIAAPANAASAKRAQSDEVVNEAETMITAAAQSNPTDTQKINQAIDTLHQALKIDPRNDSAYVDLGFAYGLLRDASAAKDMYRTATLINPSPANFKELADVYLRAGEAEQALMAANAGLVKDPHNAKLFNAKGMALNGLERFDEAEEAFRKAVTYDPSFEVARRNLESLQTGAKAAPRAGQ